MNIAAPNVAIDSKKSRVSAPNLKTPVPSAAAYWSVLSLRLHSNSRVQAGM
jgi:hypothetical protein